MNPRAVLYGFHSENGEHEIYVSRATFRKYLSRAWNREQDVRVRCVRCVSENVRNKIVFADRETILWTPLNVHKRLGPRWAGFCRAAVERARIVPGECTSTPSKRMDKIYHRITFIDAAEARARRKSPENEKNEFSRFA